MVESSIVSNEILQRPKKKNIIFDKVAISRFVSIFVFILAVTPVFTFTDKMTTKTMKPVRQKLINEIKTKADPYGIIL